MKARPLQSYQAGQIVLSGGNLARLLRGGPNPDAPNRSWLITWMTGEYEGKPGTIQEWQIDFAMPAPVEVTWFKVAKSLATAAFLCAICVTIVVLLLAGAVHLYRSLT